MAIMVHGNPFWVKILRNFNAIPNKKIEQKTDKTILRWILLLLVWTPLIADNKTRVKMSSSNDVIITISVNILSANDSSMKILEEVTSMNTPNAASRSQLQLI